MDTYIYLIKSFWGVAKFMNGLVFREGVVDITKAKRYATKNKLPFIDLRRGVTFSSMDGFTKLISSKISDVFRRPLRIDLRSFLRGECNGKRFVAVLPHNFHEEIVLMTKRSSYEGKNSLIKCEESFLRKN